MSADQLGNTLAVNILQQSLFAKPVYQEKARPPSGDGPFMILTNVVKYVENGFQHVDFSLYINPIILKEITDLCFPGGRLEADHITRACMSNLDKIVSTSLEKAFYAFVDISLTPINLMRMFPQIDPTFVRNKKSDAILSIYGSLD